MAGPQENRIYDIYLSTFGKTRAGVAMVSHDIEEKIPGAGYKPYHGEELAAAVLGVYDGKSPNNKLRSRAEVQEAIGRLLP